MSKEVLKQYFTENPFTLDELKAVLDKNGNLKDYFVIFVGEGEKTVEEDEIEVGEVQSSTESTELYAVFTYIGSEGSMEIKTRLYEKMQPSGATSAPVSYGLYPTKPDRLVDVFRTFLGKRSWLPAQMISSAIMRLRGFSEDISLEALDCGYLPSEVFGFTDYAL